MLVFSKLILLILGLFMLLQHARHGLMIIKWETESPNPVESVCVCVYIYIYIYIYIHTHTHIYRGLQKYIEINEKQNLHTKSILLIMEVNNGV